MRGSSLLLPVAASLLVPAQAQPAAQQLPPAFQAIELHGGGIVTVRHGPTRRVTVSYANPDRPIRTEGDRLVIDECRRPCPQGHHVEVDVVTPALSRVAVSDGGILHLVGDFPRQAAVAASVSSGGTVDIRWLEASNVAASVSHGGRILARPGRQLTASISDGGIITYWGDPAVTSSVRRGGAVSHGAEADLRTPLALPRRRSGRE